MKKIVFLFPIAVMLFSCGGEEVKQKAAYDYERTDSLSDEYMRNLGAIRISIENSAVLYKNFKDLGYSFNSGALNSAGKSASYSNSKSQAINMGIYSSDLNYSVGYEQAQQVTDYIKSVMDLATKLGLHSAFNEELIVKLTSNDSTVNKSILLTKAFIQAQDNLHSEDRAALATLMATGGWIESLNISIANLSTKPAEGNLNKLVWDQTFVYNNVTKMLEVFKDKNADCAEIIKLLEPLKAPITEAINTKGNFSPELITKLSTALTTVRNGLIN